MNEHPTALLADYVDDALGPDDRASVEAHLHDCPSCREEVELASGARRALEELPEIAPPAGLTFEVRRRARRAGGGLGWKIATGAAAAAVAIAGIVVALGPFPGDGAGGGGAVKPGALEEEAAGPQEGRPAPAVGDAATALRAAAPTQPQYLETDRDYDAASIMRFGERLTGQTPLSLRLGFREPATDFYANFDLDAYPRAARLAVECLLREAPPDELVVPYRIEAASFEGRPAYVGAFFQGADENAPYDRVLLWVVDREACTLRYFASFRLP